MIDLPLDIPQKSGEVLLAPRGQDLIALARSNRGRLDASPAPVGGLALGPLRAKAREHVLALARSYTRAQGLTHPEEGELLLATGHQPGLHHPGILVKYLLLDRLACRGHTGLVILVDSDAMEEVGADLPSHAGPFLERRHETLRAAEPEEPYETQAAPSADEWEDFLRRAGTHIATVREAAIRDQWEGFAAAGRPPVEQLPAFLNLLRRRWEGPRRFLDVPISLIAETETFRRFFLHIAADALHFLEIHNRRLDAYREEERIRTDAQPFPNLEQRGDLIELPFWTVRGGRRRRLWLDHGRREICALEGWRAPVPADPADPAFGDLMVRPRALTLTGYLRVALVDLFIHGISGGRYDRATDAVLAEFLGIEPPVYAVTSATLHLPFHESIDPEAERQALRRMVLEARHNPERVLADPSPAQQSMIEEKWRLIRRLDETGLTRRERKTATQAIREINERLSGGLAGRLSELTGALRALDDQSGVTGAATFRGYPFFLFEVGAVETLISAMDAPQREQFQTREAH